jgi:site-specific recombinase XerD
MSDNGIRMIKVTVEQDLDVKFDLRMCRRTFGQQYVNAGLDIESVSRLMGHANTKTTENNYCRVTQNSAVDRARQIW